MSQSVRQNLMWTATKAKKANLIDNHALEVIRKLVREPSTVETDSKIELFAKNFVQKVSVGTVCALQPAAPSALTHSANEALFLLRLPSALTEIISTFLTLDDVLSLASTCFAVNSAVYPVDKWHGRVREMLLVPAPAPDAPAQGNDNEDEEDDDGEDDADDDDDNEAAQAAAPDAQEQQARQLEQLMITKIVSVLNTPNLSPSQTISATYGTPNSQRLTNLLLYGRGTHLLCLKSPKDLQRAVMMRYLLPRLRMGSLQVKMTIDENIPDRGRMATGIDALVLTSACTEQVGDNLLVTMHFNVPIGGSPPAIHSGTSRVVLHALEGDGRTISAVSEWRVAGGAGTMALYTAEGRKRGVVGATLVGERTSKFLGRLLHDDEHYFAREMSTSASGGHGQGSWDVRGQRENITYQTPRIVYKGPSGYYEVSRNGVQVQVPIETLFHHCVCK